MVPVDTKEESPVSADAISLTRSRLPLKERVAQYVMLRAQGLRHPEIAQKMGIQISTLHSILHDASKNGLIVWENPSEKLEYALAPKIVDNIEEFLGPAADDAKRLKMTIEAAKGIGLFKSHQAVKVEGDAPKTVLALNIEFGGEVVGRRGNVVGAPTIEAEIVANAVPEREAT